MGLHSWELHEKTVGSAYCPGGSTMELNLFNAIPLANTVFSIWIAQGSKWGLSLLSWIDGNVLTGMGVVSRQTKQHIPPQHWYWFDCFWCVRHVLAAEPTAAWICAIMWCGCITGGRSFDGITCLGANCISHGNQVARCRSAFLEVSLLL